MCICPARNATTRDYCLLGTSACISVFILHAQRSRKRSCRNTKALTEKIVSLCLLSIHNQNSGSISQCPMLYVTMVIVGAIPCIWRANILNLLPSICVWRTVFNWGTHFPSASLYVHLLQSQIHKANEISGSHGSECEDGCLLGCCSYSLVEVQQAPLKRRQTSAGLHAATTQKTAILHKGSMFSAFGFMLYSPALLIKVSCSCLLSSTWSGNTALPQCMLCINRLRASCWFGCVQPLQKHCNGVQKRSEMKEVK
jgi:hypothetical protein